MKQLGTASLSSFSCAASGVCINHPLQPPQVQRFLPRALVFQQSYEGKSSPRGKFIQHLLVVLNEPLVGADLEPSPWPIVRLIMAPGLDCGR